MQEIIFVCVVTNIPFFRGFFYVTYSLPSYVWLASTPCELHFVIALPTKITKHAWWFKSSAKYSFAKDIRADPADCSNAADTFKPFGNYK